VFVFGSWWVPGTLRTGIGGVYDEQWPEWYATYFTDRLHAEGRRLSE
jgi:hypothetical protein